MPDATSAPDATGSPAAPALASPDLLFGGAGDMRARFRAHDWSSSPLGAVERWPLTLRSTTSTLLASAFAKILLWGPDLIQLYNDGYREVMGAKHPGGFAIPTRECWPEAWGFNAPIYDRVHTGETVYFDEVLIPLQRYGVMEDVWFTISYSPVLGDDGAIGGVLVTLVETTGRVLAQRVADERNRLMVEVEAERNRLGTLFDRSPSFLAVLRGPEHRFTLANEAYRQLVGYRDLVGKPVAEALPEVVDQGFIAILDQVLATGEPFEGREMPVLLTPSPGAALEARFVDFVYQPLVEPDGTRSGVVAHGHDVTTGVRARQETERLLGHAEEAARALASANAQLEAQQMELELTNQQLQDNAAELEMQSEEMQAQTEELQAQSEQLIEQTRMAEAANRAKSDFLAAMSHELRTPLNAISGYADLLLGDVRGPLAPSQRDDVERIKRSGKHLLSLINDLLNFAKLDAGQVEFRLAAVPLPELLDGLEDLVRPQVAANDLTFHMEACDPVRVQADPDKVRQVLVNLLSNAVKFTPPGGTVSVWCTNDDQTATIHVRDTGRGILPEQLQRIFDPFVQVDRHLTPAGQQGVGLGLAISRDLAHGMGGSLEAQSAPGTGSTFALSLARVD